MNWAIIGKLALTVISKTGNGVKSVGSGTKKLLFSNLAKKVTLLVILLIVIIGTAGPMGLVVLNMAEWLAFLKVFGIYFVPVVTSVGINSFKKKSEETKKVINEAQNSVVTTVNTVETNIDSPVG